MDVLLSWLSFQDYLIPSVNIASPLQGFPPIETFPSLILQSFMSLCNGGIGKEMAVNYVFCTFNTISNWYPPSKRQSSQWSLSFPHLTALTESKFSLIDVDDGGERDREKGQQIGVLYYPINDFCFPLILELRSGKLCHSAFCCFHVSNLYI